MSRHRATSVLASYKLAKEASYKLAKEDQQFSEAWLYIQSLYLQCSALCHTYEVDECDSDMEETNSDWPPTGSGDQAHCIWMQHREAGWNLGPTSTTFVCLL